MKFFSYYNFFKNFSNPVRLGIILLLKNKPMSVNELVKATGETQSNVSHHLAMLNHCRIIKARREGKNKIYSLNNEIIPLLKIAESYTKKCKKGCANAEECIFRQRGNHDG